MPAYPYDSTDDVNNQLAKAVYVRFLHCEVPTFPFPPLVFGSESVSPAHDQKGKGQGLNSPSWSRRYLNKLSRIL